jgi:hemolysin III
MRSFSYYVRMIAEDAQPPVRGREPQYRSGTAHDALRAPTGDPLAGTTGKPVPDRAAAGPESGAARAAAAVKPRMRGWLHAGMFPLALAGGIVLVVFARSAAAVAACSVYAASALLLFGTSAVYHRGDWGPRGEAVLRRLDHANIFLIIAGTYTPGRYCC